MGNDTFENMFEMITGNNDLGRMPQSVQDVVAEAQRKIAQCIDTEKLSLEQLIALTHLHIQVATANGNMLCDRRLALVAGAAQLVAALEQLDRIMTTYGPWGEPMDHDEADNPIWEVVGPYGDIGPWRLSQVLEGGAIQYTLDGSPAELLGEYAKPTRFASKDEAWAYVLKEFEGAQKQDQQ